MSYNSGKVISELVTGGAITAETKISKAKTIEHYYTTTAGAVDFPVPIGKSWVVVNVIVSTGSSGAAAAIITKASTKQYNVITSTTANTGENVHCNISLEYGDKVTCSASNTARCGVLVTYYEYDA